MNDVREGTKSGGSGRRERAVQRDVSNGDGKDGQNEPVCASISRRPVTRDRIQWKCMPICFLRPVCNLEDV